MDSITEAVLAQKTLEVVQQTEHKIDRELAKYSLNTSDDLESLRRARIEELKLRAAKEVEWRRKGHGAYSEVADQKEWFEVSKDNERVITHFYRPTTWRCEIIDKHLTLLAAKHIETKFIKVKHHTTATPLYTPHLPLIFRSHPAVSLLCRSTRRRLRSSLSVCRWCCCPRW